MNYKWIAIILFVIMYLYRTMISVISLRSEKNPIPENVSDVYDKETYEKWRAYHAETNRFEMLSFSVSTLVSFLLLVLNVYALFAGLLYGSAASALLSVPENLVQGIFGAVVSSVIYEAIRKRSPKINAFL